MGAGCMRATRRPSRPRLAAASLVVHSPATWRSRRAARKRRLRACCATQTENLASAAHRRLHRLLSPGRLHGKPAGVAYALRGLAYLDRGDIAHAIADLNQAVALAPDFAPAYQNRGNAWYARGNFGQALADYDTAIKLDPNSPSPYVNRATRAARPRLYRRRAGGLPEGDQPRRRTAPVSIAAAASSICASTITRARVADFDRALAA